MTVFTTKVQRNLEHFDKDLIISYWTSGWWGYDVAKPIYFANKVTKF